MQGLVLVCSCTWHTVFSLTLHMFIPSKGWVSHQLSLYGPAWLQLFACLHTIAAKTESSACACSVQSNPGLLSTPLHQGLQWSWWGWTWKAVTAQAKAWLMCAYKLGALWRYGEGAHSLSQKMHIHVRLNGHLAQSGEAGLLSRGSWAGVATEDWPFTSKGFKTL